MRKWILASCLILSIGSVGYLYAPSYIIKHPPALLMRFCHAVIGANDWPGLNKFEELNKQLPSDSARVVFIGDSIISNWSGFPEQYGDFFPRHPQCVSRAVALQTTSQMLLRFRQDVLDLKPGHVFILGGTNDFDMNDSIELTKANLASMCELARLHNIGVILATIPPISEAHTDRINSNSILALNNWMRSYAKENSFQLIDVYHVLAGNDNLMRAEYSNDGRHPNEKGYAEIEKAISLDMRAVLH